MPSNRTYTLGQALRLACQARTPARPRYRYPTNSYSTQSHSSSSSDLKGLADEQDPHESARARLRPLVDSFDGKVDYAVAYGSGVIHQANRPTTNEVGLVAQRALGMLMPLVVRPTDRLDYLGAFSEGIPSDQLESKPESLSLFGEIGG
jgi:hypothetical protein